MDDLVKQALAKWPDVPDCHGWLALDGRGRWRIGKERETISHLPTVEFINRNYLADESGRWLFQNGPQRVFVDLDFTPFIWRLIPEDDASAQEDSTLVAHTGDLATHTSDVWLIGNGRFLINANQRVGILHDHDSALLLERLCDAEGKPVDEARSAEILAELMEGLAWGKRQNTTAPIHVRLPGAKVPLPLGTISADDIPRRFRFIARPSEQQ